MCRYGGEEFVMLLPGGNLEDTRVRAEEIRAKVRECTVSYQGRSVGKISISAGVAAFPAHGILSEDLIIAADAALYAAKKAGRDRVEIADVTELRQGATPSITRVN